MPNKTTLSSFIGIMLLFGYITHSNAAEHTQTLKAFSETYDNGMDIAYKAYDEGTITDAHLAKIESCGDAFYVSYDKAVISLEKLKNNSLEGDEDTTAALVDAAHGILSQFLNTLSDLEII